MKKFFVLVAVLALVPFTAFGMEELADNVMDEITGQAGVTITFGGADSVVTATSSGVAWGDPDGAGDPDGVPAHLRIDGDMTTTTTVAAGSSMTIDVDAVSGVIIGLSDMDVGVEMAAAQLTIGAGVGPAPVWADDPAAVMGVLSLSSTTVNLALPSALSINAH
jgi:hypothetical protein